MASGWAKKRTILCILFLICVVFFFPLLNGAIYGALFSRWYAKRVERGEKESMNEIERTAWTNLVSVPGAPPMSSWQDNSAPYFIPSASYCDWTKKLRFVLPKDHYDDDVTFEKLASPEHIVRDVVCSDAPMEQWVYVSRFAMPDAFAWDKAFDELLQHLYARSGKENATSGIFYAQCASTPFLCTVWGARPPSLVHFRVEQHLQVENAAERYQQDPSHLRPVTVRVIDLPLTSAGEPSIPGRFPSEFEQLRTLVTIEGAYEDFDAFHPAEQLFKRFWDYLYEVINVKGSFLDYTSDAENWKITQVYKPMGISEASQFAKTLSFGASAIIGAAILCVARAIRLLIEWFLAKPTHIDLFYRRLDQLSENGGFFQSLVAGFSDMLSSWNASSLNVTASGSGVPTT
jgi:hypothetical protein